ncbi:alpha/beta hydrolase family esterase [Nesterenkonia xinjiangensis]|uniref:Polyhydroxybutyrate depolymerase n=1 Tax=Nesterenkonia xinjiangensis TaxID=225327 RepID=A0A7Z0K847_9MICC|nr:alpha/beta hydrolase-fold protein [Nesterenkonia xinjiangensis]NYJ77224.1 polyhydroxybutyrate depolymerase [Nesterenkonia xinjiangensis]
MNRAFLRRASLGLLGFAAAGGILMASPDAPSSQASEQSPTDAAKGVECTAPVPQAVGSSAKHSMVSGALEREYILTLPEDYASRSDWPLIVAFHGRGSTGVEVEGYSRLSDLPAVVAYPFGVFPDNADPRRAWQGAPYSDPEVDDVAFAEDLVDHLDAELCLDGEQVFATGKSNGGGLALALACRIPDRITAAAAAAPALYPETRQACLEPSRSPSMIIHGTDDVTIPYGGDPDRDLPDIEEWGLDLAQASRCRPHPDRTHVGDDVEYLSWSACARGGEVTVVSVQGGGHVWPGAAAYSGGGFTTRTLDGNEAVWEFFMKSR